MAGEKKQQQESSKKRKQNSNPNPSSSVEASTPSKKQKFTNNGKGKKEAALSSKKEAESAISNSRDKFKSNNGKWLKNPKLSPHQKSGGKKFEKSDVNRRSNTKELTEERKKKRKPNYELQHQLALLWEKMRRRNISKEDRSKLITEALGKMKGKIPEIAGSHVSSRVLQTCIKYCQQSERDMISEELRPQFLTLATNKYAVHLVKKMLDNANKKQLDMFISSLQGQVASLIRHAVGSAVIEHAYQLGNASQRRGLLVELVSTEFRLFKGLSSLNEGRLVDLISKLGIKKAAVLEYMSSILQQVIAKKLVGHSIVHSLVLEFFNIAGKASTTDLIQQLSGPLLIQMIHTRDGSRIGALCVKYGTAKERKKIIKSMKGHVQKIALDQYGNMVLNCILSTVDDTERVAKVIVKELQSGMEELLFNKYGRRPFLQLLRPYCSRYFAPDDLAMLNLSIPSLCTSMGPEAGGDLTPEAEMCTKAQLGDNQENRQKDSKNDKAVSAEKFKLEETREKDPSLRRSELLINSGLAEKMISICSKNVAALLQSNFGKDVVYELATGGAGGILWNHLGDKLDALHSSIAGLGAQRKADSEEHVFENFHSSRIIRNMILECPRFATTLWKESLKGRCAMWAQGHSCKVVSAFMEVSYPEVKELAKCELQPLVDSGVLKGFQNQHT